MGDTANRNDSDATTYYNRRTTTDDTAIYGISDAHARYIAKSAIDIQGVYRAYNNRVVPKRDGMSNV